MSVRDPLKQPTPLGVILGRKCVVAGCRPQPDENILKADDNCGFELCVTHALAFQKWIHETNPVRMAEWIRKQGEKPKPAPSAEAVAAP